MLHSLEPILALVVVVLAIVVAGRVARKFLPRSYPGLGDGRAGRLALRETLSIDQNRRVIVVACDARQFLVLLAPSGDTLLGQVDPTGTFGPGLAA